MRSRSRWSSRVADGRPVLRSTRMDDGHVVAVPPHAGDVERDSDAAPRSLRGAGLGVEARLRRLAARPELPRQRQSGHRAADQRPRRAWHACTRDFGAVRSKYDCLLGANLHPQVPGDRHILVKRVRAWVNADGFITPLDAAEPGCSSSPVRRRCGRSRATRATGAASAFGSPSTCCAIATSRVLRFERVPTQSLDLAARGARAPDRALRLEDRTFHGETHADAGAGRALRGSHAARSTGARLSRSRPAPERTLTVSADRGRYHAEPSGRATSSTPSTPSAGSARGDAYSPGWFELPLAAGRAGDAGLLGRSRRAADRDRRAARAARRRRRRCRAGARSVRGAAAARGRGVRRAARRGPHGDRRLSVVSRLGPRHLHRRARPDRRRLRRRGAADAAHLRRARARGTLPNYLVGREARAAARPRTRPCGSALACEELAAAHGACAVRLAFDRAATAARGAALHRRRATCAAPNGVHVDPESGLVWSPSHFTWMDTNYPAGTPREGYPIELSVLWLRCLCAARAHRRAACPAAILERVAARTERLAGALFYRPELGYCADTLHAPAGVPGARRRADDHLRPNQLIAVSLGCIDGRAGARDRRRRRALSAGAWRTAHARAHAGQVRAAHRGRRRALLNIPEHPYWGSYDGDEDTRRKPAYHNGTAWGWWLPIYCEALAAAWDSDAAAVAAARAVLGSSGTLACRRLPRSAAGDHGWRCAARPARLRRAGLERHRGVRVGQAAGCG